MKKKDLNDKDTKFVAKAFNDWVKSYVKASNLTEDEILMLRSINSKDIMVADRPIFRVN